jgi:NADH-quinone oxidoreductase subunit A
VDAWVSVFAFLFVAAVMAGSPLLLTKILGVVSKRRTALTTRTYECGEEPEGSAWLKFHPRYYVVALVFVLFDIEAVFLYAWALVLRKAGWLAIIDMFVFIGVLLLAWAYAMKKGALKWQ